MIPVILKLIREETSEEATHGRIAAFNGFDRERIVVYTLELPWRENRRGESRIYAGKYSAWLWESPTFGMTVIRLEDKHNRLNILIHPANWTSQLAGCIAPGTSRSIDQNAVWNSRDAMTQLVDFCDRYAGDRGFVVEVYDPQWKECFV